jgi:hypothetical protein
MNEKFLDRFAFITVRPEVLARRAVAFSALRDHRKI